MQTAMSATSATSTGGRITTSASARAAAAARTASGPKPAAAGKGTAAAGPGSSSDGLLLQDGSSVSILVGASANASADANVLQDEAIADVVTLPTIPETRVGRWRRKTYQFFSDPSSSRGALYFSIYMNLLIVFSTLAFCLQTVPTLNNSSGDTAVWWTIEIFVTAQFTFEYTIRLVCAPNRKAFLISPLNIVDLVSIIPFYLELVVVAVFGTTSTITAIAVIRVVRLVRVFRLFKLGSQSKQVRMVARAFARSRDGIFLLAFMLGLAVTFFSTCMYFAETASCTLGPDDVWYYNADTVRPGTPTEYQVRNRDMRGGG